MSETQALFTALRQVADPDVVDAIDQLVSHAPDQALCRINAIDLAGHAQLDEERVIAGLLQASRLGLFDLNWNILCPAAAACLTRMPP